MFRGKDTLRHVMRMDLCPQRHVSSLLQLVLLLIVLNYCHITDWSITCPTYRRSWRNKCAVFVSEFLSCIKDFLYFFLHFKFVVPPGFPSKRCSAVCPHMAMLADSCARQNPGATELLQLPTIQDLRDMLPHDYARWCIASLCYTVHRQKSMPLFYASRNYETLLQLSVHNLASITSLTPAKPRNTRYLISNITQPALFSPMFMYWYSKLQTIGKSFDTQFSPNSIWSLPFLKAMIFNVVGQLWCETSLAFFKRPH